MFKDGISRRSFILGGGAVLGSLAAGTLSSSCSNLDTYKTKVRAALSISSDNFVPLQNAYPLLNCINWHLFEGLYRIGRTSGKPFACLADGDPIKVDDLIYDVKVFTDRKYSNGDTIKLSDIYEVVNYISSDELFVSIFDFIDKFEIINDDTFRIYLAYPLDINILMERLSYIRFFKVINRPVRSYADVVGTGPYVLKSGDGSDGGTLYFEPNKFYKGENPPEEKGMIWNIITDNKLRTDALLSGKVNIIENAFPEDIWNLRSLGFEVSTLESLSMAMFAFNCAQPPFDDVRVRQAVMYAINVDGLINSKLKGYAKSASCYLPEYHSSFHRCKNVYSYNPAKARKLLKEAGQERFRLNLVGNQSSWESTLAPQIQEDLAAVGISVVNKTTTMNWYDIASTEDIDYHIALMGIDPSFWGKDTDLLLLFLYGDNFVSNKFTFWKYAKDTRFYEFNDLLTKARSLSGEAQQNVWNDCLDLISEEVPIYPLLHRNISTVWNPTAVKGVQPIGFDGLSLLGCYCV